MQPHRWQPTRLPHPSDSPGKNNAVGCRFLLQCMKVKSESEVIESCPTLSNSIDCSLPGSSIRPWDFPGKSTGVGCHCLLRELPYDPAIPLLGIHTEETRIERDTCTPMFISALFIKSLLVKLKVECEKVGLKLNIQKTKIMASGPNTPW